MMQGQTYTVDEAFNPFLQCYHVQNKLIDALVLISAESYARGQVEMADMYLTRAVAMNEGHTATAKLRKLVYGENGEIGVEVTIDLDNDLVKNQLWALRDSVDISKPRKRTLEGSETSENSGDAFWNRFKETRGSESNTENDDDIINKSPEEIYNVATTYFNNKDLALASELFEISCQKSNSMLSPACANAIYLRTNLCDWGEEGKGFERDMKSIEQITISETSMYRSIVNATDKLRRQNGIHDKMSYEGGVIHWKRATSVHPHMMLGYPLDSTKSILKRYVAESMASLDEIRARVDHDTTSIKELPRDLPYSVEEMRARFVNQLKNTETQKPIKVGFVGCGFNSKAVMYLSQDMFRFFDPSVVEVHVFSTGRPDHPLFIQGTMRGVDWRQNVIDNVDYFHDVSKFQDDHIGLARYIHNKEIQVLIEWDGYARQGERAAGLMALRPCPVQILHQEFLMTSGAQYIDYIITDNVVSPRSLEHLYTEKFLYLPNHFFSKGHAMQKEVIPPSLSYVPREPGAAFQLGVGSPQENACLSSSPLRGTSGHEKVSFVYCNFNKFLKHNPETTRSWIRILQEVPDSILCLLENPKEGIPNLRKFVSEISEDNNPALNLNHRIHFLPWEQNPFDHQRRSHSLCNVMLDSHPYNGHTTAQDALYAGVPIVTRSDGDDMSSRVTTSANKVLGLNFLNADGVKEYEDIAIRIGNDKRWFDSIRLKLIDTCLQRDPMHPYWDVPRYVKNFERGLEMAWGSFLKGGATIHIQVPEDGEQNSGTFDSEIIDREAKRRNHKRDSRRMGSEL
jgi:protein O-GlcNAc transferase